jgi:hypothetical protein
MIGYVGLMMLLDVAHQLMFIVKVCAVGLLGPLVPFACEHAAAAGLLKSLTDSANASEQINKAETGRAGWPMAFLKDLPQSRLQKRRTRHLSAFPSGDGFGTYLQSGSDFTLCHSLPKLKQEAMRIGGGLDIFARHIRGHFVLYSSQCPGTGVFAGNLSSIDLKALEGAESKPQAPILVCAVWQCWGPGHQKGIRPSDNSENDTRGG